MPLPATEAGEWAGGRNGQVGIAPSCGVTLDPINTPTCRLADSDAHAGVLW